jgi:adenylate cyclase
MSARQQVCARVLEAARESRASVEAMQYPIGEPSNVSASASRCMSENPVRQYRRRQPARLHLHRSRRQSRGAAGKDRRPPHRTIVASEGFAGICAGGWSDLGEFPIAGFSKAERVYGLLDETPAA